MSTDLQIRTYWPPREIRTRRTAFQRLRRQLTPFGWCCLGLLLFWSGVGIAVFA